MPASGLACKEHHLCLHNCHPRIEVDDFILTVCTYLFPSLIYEVAALLEVGSDLGFREVQDLERLIDHRIWEHVIDSICNI